MKAHRHTLVTTSLLVGFTALAPQIGRAAEAEPADGPMATNGTGQAAALLALQGQASGAAAASQDCPDGSKPVNGACPNAVKEVVVTGSRIAHVSTTTPQPVEILSGEEIQARGYTNLADAINQIPALGGGVTPIGDQNGFGTGFNYVDLFGLGSNRTLTLVNGLRFISDNPNSIFANNGGTQVDLNALPSLLIDRVETVQATGAAVYGSDAIAGVVNIIEKKHFEGIQFNLQSGESTYGDTPRYEVEVAAGHNFLGGKLNVAVDFQYDRTNELSQANRPWTAQQNVFSPNPAYDPNNPQPGVPAQIVTPNYRWSGMTTGGLPLLADGQTPITTQPGGSTILQFGKGGALVPYNPGTLYGPFIGGNASGGDALNLAPILNLQVPLDRKVVTALVNYDVTPHFRLHANLNFSDVDAIQQADQAIYTIPVFGLSPSYNSPFPGSAMLISLDNAFLSPQVKNVISQNIVAAGGDPANGFYLSRVNTDVAPIPVTSTDKTYNVQLVAEGDFEAFNRKFDWNLDYSGGVSDTTFDQSYFVYGNSGTLPNGTAFNVPNLFGYALDSVLVNGTPTCRVKAQNPTSTDPNIANCVPFNPFGLGNDNAKSVAYFMRPFNVADENMQQDFQANLATSLVTLPAGPLKANIGYEHRFEIARLQPNLNSIEGTGYSVPILPQSGSYGTNEYYIEAFAPIFGENFRFPLLYKLELQGAWRDVQNTLAGEGKSWSYGAQYSPIKDIIIRGSRSKTFRNPSLQEALSPDTTAYDTGLDPCTTGNINTGPNPAVRAKNCATAFAQLGIPLSSFTTDSVESGTIPVTSGGNPKLKNEIGNSFTYGVVLQPRFIPGLIATADYVQINITDAIEYFGVGGAMEACYDNPTFPNPACSLFQRASAATATPGYVVTAQESYINAGYDKFAGANYSLFYTRPINRMPLLGRLGLVNSATDLGRFTMNFNATNIRREINSVSGSDFDAINSAGTVGTGGVFGAPRWRWIASFTYDKGPIRAEWTSHWIQSSYYSLTTTSASQIPIQVKDSLTHDLSLAYNIGPHLTAKLNILNVFNSPPPSPVGTYSTGYYDFIGRYFLFGLSGKF